jgi:hypothetical protein
VTYSINQIWLFLGLKPNGPTKTAYVSMGTSTPTTAPFATSWAKGIAADHEEWVMPVSDVVTRYIMICESATCSSVSLNIHKLAVFQSQTCGTNTPTVTLTTSYSPITATGSAITVPWPNYTIVPADCFGYSDILIKDCSGNDLVLAGLFTIDWVNKVITFNSNLGCKSDASMSVVINTLTPFTAPVIPLTFVCPPDPCLSTTINPATMSPTTPYQMQNPMVSASVLSFMMHTDSYGISQNNPTRCGTRTYTSSCPWLSVLTPVDPLTMPY